MSEPDEAAKKCQHGVNPGFACNECSVAARHTVIVGDEAAVEAVAQAIQQADYEWEVAAGCQMPVGDPWHYIARGFLATPVVADWRRDAERLRDLAAMFEGHPNRDQQTYRGVQIAAMLRGDGA